MEPVPWPSEPKVPSSEPQPQEPLHPETPHLETKRRKNKKLVIALALVLILLIAGLVYWFFIKKESPSTQNNTETNTANQTENTETAKIKQADEIYYFYGEKVDGPFKLYRRPAQGGERQEITQVPSYPNYLAKNDKVYLFSTNRTIWLGKFDGSKPKEMITLPENTDVVGGRISDDSSKILLSTSSYTNEAISAIIYSFNGDGVNQKKVYENKENAAMIINGYDGKDKLVVMYNCWNCDGFNNPNNSFTLDARTGQTQNSSAFDYFDGLSIDNYQSFYLDKDLKTVYYLKPTTDKSIKTDTALGYESEYYIGAPYALNRVDTSTKQETTLVGQLGEKKVDTRYVDKMPWYYWKGFLGDNGLFFENKIFQYSASNVTTLHEFAVGQKVMFPVHVSSEELIVGSYVDDMDNHNQDIQIYYIDLSAKKTTEIMKAPETQTVFLGVSLK